MGSVYAKERTIMLTENDLKKKVRVDKVHVEGVCRTKDDILYKAVKGLFNAENTLDVLQKVKYATEELQSLGAFKSIDCSVELSESSESSSIGLEVIYQVEEKRRISGGIQSEIERNEGILAFGVRFPNLFGRGESLDTACQYGSKKTKGFNVVLSKPLLGWAKPRVTAALFQQDADVIWSGFREIDRGLLMEVLFESSPRVSHNIRWEGIWRDLKCLTPASAFAIREQMGHSLKSSVKHIVTVDKRDRPIFPSCGSYFKLTQEFAGLGGSIGFLKHELQYEVNRTIVNDVVLQGSVAAGTLRAAGKNKSYGIADKFFLGGPFSLRGFTMRGVGPHSEDNALGSESFWVAGLHLYTPLPFRPGRGGIGDYFRTHVFLNAGNIGKFSFSEDYYQNLATLLTNYRLTYGAGVVVSVFDFFRIELNYCIPVKFQLSDKLNMGLQFGVGVSFL